MTAVRDILVLGASGFGRELLWLLGDVLAVTPSWRLTGFLDDDLDGARASLEGHRVGVPVLGTIRDHRPRSQELFVSAIGMCRPKLAVCESIVERGGEFADVVHPTAKRHPTATVGRGVIMSPLSGFGPGAVVGDFVAMSASAGTGHDAIVGDGCFLGARCDVMGRAALGRGVFLGSHVTVHPGVSVDDFTIVGSGSAVIRSAKRGLSMIGVPARALPQ